MYFPRWAAHGRTQTIERASWKSPPSMKHCAMRTVIELNPCSDAISLSGPNQQAAPGDFGDKPPLVGRHAVVHHFF